MVNHQTDRKKIRKRSQLKWQGKATWKELEHLGRDGAQITGVAGEGTGRGHPEEGKAQR